MDKSKKQCRNGDKDVILGKAGGMDGEMARLWEEIHEQPEVIRKLWNELPLRLEQRPAEGKEIFLFGTGASLSACMQAKYAFLKYRGVHGAAVAAFEAEYYKEILDKGCLAAVVSQSGESYETKVIVNGLLEKGIPFWGITNNEDSFLGKNASCCLPLMAGEELGTATKTQTASVMALYMMAAIGHEGAMRQLEKLPEAMEATLQAAEGYKQELADFLSDRKAIYLTGLDAHAPTALQASLMLKEKVWLHAEGLSLAEFRHGPVEVVEEGIPIVLIGYGKEKIDTLLMHADFLTKVCHGDVVLVTNCQENRIKGYRNFPYVWEGDEALSHICATLPFQLLAERMAAQRGYDIDGFKYIGKVLNQYEKPIK